MGFGQLAGDAGVSRGRETGVRTARERAFATLAPSVPGREAWDAAFMLLKRRGWDIDVV
jgi:hypothetical protein